MDMKPDPASVFGYFSTIFQCIKNPVNAVVFHRDEVARAQLRPRCACVEECRCRVRHIFLRHRIIRVLNIDKCFIDRDGVLAPAVNPECDAHPHMLRAFNDHPVAAHQIGPLERLKPEIIDEVVSRMVDHLFNRFMNKKRSWTRHRTISGCIYNFV